VTGSEGRRRSDEAESRENLYKKTSSQAALQEERKTSEGLQVGRQESRKRMEKYTYLPGGGEE